MPKTPSNWLTRAKGTAGIRGALKFGAYVAQAYKHERSTGALPKWAKRVKSPRKGGAKEHWHISPAYVKRDARQNLRYMAPTEIASAMDASRRAALNWIDEGLLGPVTFVGKARERRVLRTNFEAARPKLRARMESNAAVGTRMLRGKAVPPEAAARAMAKRARRMKPADPNAKAMEIARRIRAVHERGVISAVEAFEQFKTVAGREGIPEDIRLNAWKAAFNFERPLP